MFDKVVVGGLIALLGEMGIDLIAGGRRVGHNTRRAPESKNVYLKLLFKLFR